VAGSGGGAECANARGLKPRREHTVERSHGPSLLPSLSVRAEVGANKEQNQNPRSSRFSSLMKGGKRADPHLPPPTPLSLLQISPSNYLPLGTSECGYQCMWHRTVPLTQQLPPETPMHGFARAMHGSVRPCMGLHADAWACRNVLWVSACTHRPCRPMGHGELSKAWQTPTIRVPSILL